MYEKIENCPICESSDFENELICEDHSVSNEQFVIVRCKKCSFLFTNPRPDENNIENYYNSDTYISHNSKGYSPLTVIYKLVRSLALFQKQRLIKRFALGNFSLLDYGSGSGHFLSYCKNKGWQVTGFEPSTEARNIANGLTQNSVVESVDKLQDNYQIITLWHVLEHIPNLNDTIALLKSKLNKKGTLIVAIPNSKSWDAMHYKNHWAAYDLPRHLYHFNQDNLKQLMKKHKLKIKEVLPMKMDSFYVSMLSEQNKFGKNNFLRSIINGIKSNNFGEKNNSNYSSLIYIIQK